MKGHRGLNLLTVNTGSSSVKMTFYRIGNDEEPIMLAGVDRIGSRKSHITIKHLSSNHLIEHEEAIPTHGAALKAVLTRTSDSTAISKLDGVGHRGVVGDRKCLEPMQVTEQLLSAFNQLVSLAPDHLPQVIDCISIVKTSYPDVPQVACFDSMFHRRMPPIARMFGVPRRFYEQGIFRYGFHGLSCEYIMQALTALNDPTAQGRVIIAHLGNGSSITAVQQGVSIDTTMGLTPLAGMVMGTRSKDIDPGAVTHIGNKEGMTFSQLNNLLNKESGLLGVSGYSADMRDLLERESTDAHCAETIAMFCYQARKFIAAYAAALGGLDTLVFTGGIGEKVAVIRERICFGMDFMGIVLDATANGSNAPVISGKDSHVTVRVINTNEDLIIARHTWRVITTTSFVKR